MVLTNTKQIQNTNKTTTKKPFEYHSNTISFKKACLNLVLNMAERNQGVRPSGMGWNHVSLFIIRPFVIHILDFSIVRCPSNDLFDFAEFADCWVSNPSKAASKLMQGRPKCIEHNVKIDVGVPQRAFYDTFL